MSDISTPGKMASGAKTAGLSGTSILDRLAYQRAERGAAPAYFEKQGEAWVPTSWSAYGERIEQSAKALLTLGLNTGDIVCILGKNRAEWTTLDLASMMAGGASAGIYQTCSPEEITYILNHSEAPVLVAEDESYLETVAKIAADCPHLKHIIMMRGAKADHPLAMTWEAFLLKADDTSQEILDRRIAEITPDNIAGLIYTSGTTGPPKAVALSHKAVLAVAGNSNDFLGANDDDVLLSYLPLSHIAEKALSIYGPLGGGQTIYFAQSLDTLLTDLTQVRPTIFFAVPRVWEKIQAGLSLKMASAEGRKKRIIENAMTTGKAYYAHMRAGTKPPLSLRMKYRLYHKAVYANVQAAIGLDRVKLCSSGAAAIAKDTPVFFNGIGLQIGNVYGLSENGGGATADLPHSRIKLGAVGKPIVNFDVKIAEDDEILLRGNSMFSEYVKNPKATMAALDGEWFATGDLGYIDDEDYVFVTGRKKDLIITSGGKNITPSNLETDMMSLPFVEHAVAVGDGFHFLSALITLDVAAINQGLGSDDDYADLAAQARVRDALREGIEDMNTHHTRAANIREFRILPKPLTIEDGFLTPTLKVKRAKIIKAYQAIVDDIYGKK